MLPDGGRHQRDTKGHMMNDTTAALLDLLQIDRQAMDASLGFYRNRHHAAYAVGLLAPAFSLMSTCCRTDWALK